MRTPALLGVCLTLGCASSAPNPTLGRTGERIVDIQDRSGTVVNTRLRSDDQTRTADLNLGFEVAWTRLPALLAELGLSIGSINEASGRVSHSGERVSRIAGERLSTYLDCGTGTTAQPNANAYGVFLSYEVLIAAQGPGASVAEMRIDATARPRDVSGNPVRCTSKGALERLLFDGLQAPG